ncbi:MAG: hypothetical protein JKY56_20020 [Kofleriaceae bacterium]|nr:hypothetical protein [Kofleriaceae bacterium]
MFADLQAELDSLPEVSVVAVGGLPIILSDGHHRLFGGIATIESVRTELKKGLGLGAVLTYRNPKGKSLEELGELSLQYNHLWTAHILTLTLAFDACPIAVRNAFAFDRRFHLSWVETEVQEGPCTFTATASVREWKRMTSYADNASFKSVVRAWFGRAKTVLVPLLE